MRSQFSIFLFILGFIGINYSGLYGQEGPVFPMIAGSWEVVESEDLSGTTPLFGSTDFTGQYLHIMDGNRLAWQNEKGYFVAKYKQDGGMLHYDDFKLKIEYVGEDVIRVFYNEPISKRRVNMILEKGVPLTAPELEWINENIATDNLEDDAILAIWVPAIGESETYDKAYGEFPLAWKPAAKAEVYKVVEEMPRFPGCEDMDNLEERKGCAQQELLKYIYKNIRYPEAAKSKGIEGVAVVTFVVGMDGTVSGARIVRDISDGIGEEALRIVNQMNPDGIRWVPGVQRGRPVNVQFNLPIKFKIR